MVIVGSSVLYERWMSSARCFAIDAMQPIPAGIVPSECGAVAHDAPISVHRDIAPSHARGAIWQRLRDCDAFGMIVAEFFLGRGFCKARYAEYKGTVSLRHRRDELERCKSSTP